MTHKLVTLMSLGRHLLESGVKLPPVEKGQSSVRPPAWERPPFQQFGVRTLRGPKLQVLHLLQPAPPRTMPHHQFRIVHFDTDALLLISILGMSTPRGADRPPLVPAGLF